MFENRSLIVAMALGCAVAVPGVVDVMAQETTADARPCERSPVHRQFDFWEGEWEVRTADGTLAGTNRIERVAGGCALSESWTSARSAYVGRSLNYVDAAQGKWVQVWTDSDGNVIALQGGLAEGSMRLVGELIDRQGRKSPFRGVWTPLPDGRVRQLLEESKDGGKSWAQWFDGYYGRKGPRDGHRK